MDTKTLAGIRVKSADKGEVTALFSALGVRDKDGDVTLPGAFTDGAPVKISAYGHGSWEGMLPVGKGVIRAGQAEAVMEGRFFLDTAAGRDTFTVVKELGELQEWSYGYNVLDSEYGDQDGEPVRFLKRLEVYEVSPVLRGAGVGTRTLDVKSAGAGGADGGQGPVLYKAAVRPHETPTVAGAWDAEAVKASLAEGASISDLRSVAAWVDPAGDPEVLGSYHYLHHGKAGGPANLRACVMWVAALNGAPGGPSVGGDDRAGVYEHLASHLRDADREPPELRAGPSSQMKFLEETADVMCRFQALRGRASEIVALRRSKGKALAPSSSDMLEWLFDEMRELRALIDTPRDDMAREYLRFMSTELPRG